MADKLIGTFPCGFNFTTPFGEAEAVEVMQNHMKRLHKKDYPNGVTKAQAIEHVNKA